MTTLTRISVTAPARLHMGFIDLSGTLGRHFGSIGIALNDYVTTLTVSPAPQRLVSGASRQRADKYLSLLCNALQVSDQVDLKIIDAIPEHIGLGSGTQLSLAIGAALNALYDLKLNVRDIAALMDRGLRSGIGIGVFEQGGLLVDGGRGEHTITPPLLVRMAVPDDWRFILAFDNRGQGLHGQQEIQAFSSLAPFPRAEAERLCYLLLMQALPAVAENDLIRFGEVITDLQATVGAHFAPAQGGLFSSPEVAEAMAWFKQQGAVALGQTSWGPTGFCAVTGHQVAEALVAAARLQFAHLQHLSFSSVSVRNVGGEIQIDTLSSD